MTPERYCYQRYLLMTLDPVHPGAGGYRLGRVDNSIAREPGTRLPKIPGSSLHGAVRSYAAYLYGTPEAAGQSQKKVDEPEKNPVCYTFGYIKNKKMSSGVVNLFDAQLLLFPVHSLRGPVWVSTPQRLRKSGFEAVPNSAPPEKACWTTFSHQGGLNLGWLMLEVADTVQVQPPDEWQAAPQWQEIAQSLVLVSETLFPHIVNSNLEVRTSVAINPQTGAAEEHALYTYEAIPRATFLSVEVMLDDYKAEENNRPFPVTATKQGKTLPGGEWQGPLDVVKAGLNMIEYLGVGGMGTRGFGRIQVIGKPVEKNQQAIFGNLEEKQQ